MRNKKVIVIGGVAGGMSAASQAKRINKDLEIVVFEKGNYVSYAQCGLPYYIADLTEDKEDLVVRTPEDFEERDITVKTMHEVTGVDVGEKTVMVKNKRDESTFKESYDTLLIATGTSPNLPPIDGIELDHVMTLKTIPDGEKIKEMVSKDHIKNIVLAGGGYIGAELMETMVRLKKDVRMIHRPKQLLPIMDPEFGVMVKDEAERHGVKVHTGETVEALIGEGQLEQVKTDKDTYPADLVILALGVRPNTDIFKDCGLDMQENGAIIVDKKGRTNLSHIYGAGDCTTVYHKLKKKDVFVPLGTYANRQGKVTGENIAGLDKDFEGVLGTSIVKVLDRTFGKTGLSEKEVSEMDIPYDTKTVEVVNHAKTYPGQKPITIKLVYHKDKHTILGAQMAGEDGVSGRLDVFALAIDQGVTTETLNFVDFSYAPPFATPWDAVQIAAMATKQ